MIICKSNIEEKCDPAQKNILKLTALQDALLLYNGILNYELTLTMQNLDVTQKTAAKLRVEKITREVLRKKYVGKQIGFTQNVIEIYKIESKVTKSVDHWRIET